MTDSQINSISNIIVKVSNLKEDYAETDIQKVFREFPKDNTGLYKKSEILAYFINNEPQFNLSTDIKKKFLEKIKMKKTRTISGVTPVTVLTKPFPCPGKCIFCPNDVRMPKSYLRDEPGAQRAFRNKFDPYLQTYNRLLAYKNIGHSTDKVELIVLGGTWSSYPRTYQIWFIKRCFDAMNDFNSLNDSHQKTELTDNSTLPLDLNKLHEIDGSTLAESYNQVVKNALDINHSKEEIATIEELFLVHKINETSQTRCIGLVVETRPDEISIEEARFLRSLGATKIQIGVQSMDDNVLRLNKRGHDVAKTKEALNILRSFGFKIHVHYMPNLYGSNPENDILDYKKVFDDLSIKPDEIKIYPCSLIGSAELMQYYKKGLWKPYTESELLNVLKECVKYTPEYCRITRMIRDICSQDIIVGNKKTNFRQIVDESLAKDGTNSDDIRFREIKAKNLARSDLKIKEIKYETLLTTEYFIEFIGDDNTIAGFLRLSLPKSSPDQSIIRSDKDFPRELIDAAMIREIHVYGEAIDIGKQKDGKAQHLGLGKDLIKYASNIAKENKFNKLAVISSVGTREYYRKNGFEDGELYQTLDLV